MKFNGIVVRYSSYLSQHSDIISDEAFSENDHFTVRHYTNTQIQSVANAALLQMLLQAVTNSKYPVLKG